MMARRTFALILLALSAGGGCCCPGTQPCGLSGSGGGGCGPGYLCLPKPIVWCGNENECGPGGCGQGDCDSCACPDDCGILPALGRGLSCGKGCGEIYWGEWYSDPPDCCDPCDDCGNWTGPHGFCNLGPCQRLLAAFHGYKYCPNPCTGPSCGGFCNKASCATGGCTSCGGGGCDSCGGGEMSHAQPIETYHHEGHSGGHEGGLTPEGHVHPQSILHDNWETPPGPKPVPGKPIHKAQQPQPRYTHAAPPARLQPNSNRMVRTAGYPAR